MMTRSQYRTGWSLLEVIAAVAIIAMASTLSAAMLGAPSINSGRARSSVDDLVSLLRMARNTAIARQQPVEVRLANSVDGTWVSNVVTGSVSSPGAPIVVPFVPQTGVTIRNWPGNIRFNPQGNSNTNVDAFVGYGGREYRLRLYQASGVLRINRP